MKKGAFMAQIAMKGKPIHTVGELPKIGAKAPPFTLVDADLKDRTLAEFQGKKKILATVPSLDTGTCSLMTKRLNEFAKKHPEFVVLVVSADLPFAQKRFCQAETVENVITLSMMRDKNFGESYGLLIQDGPLKGILARSLLLLDGENRVLYHELVSEVTTEPKYEEAFRILEGS
jgi:thioredoxin-dependent peroxiredoxin